MQNLISQCVKLGLFRFDSHFFRCIIVLIWLFGLPLTPAPIEKLTLNRAFELALELNEDEKIRSEELEIAEARYYQALSNYFPQLSLFYTKQYRDKLDRSRTVTSDAASLSQQLRAIEMGTYLFQYTGSNETRAQQNPDQAGVGLTWPLFSGFRTYHDSKAADSLKLSKQEMNQRQRQLLFRDIAEVFYQTIQYSEAAKIYDEEEKALKVRIAEVGRFVGLGRSPQGDLLLARSDLANSLVEAETNRALLEASKELLGFLIGRSPNQWQIVDEQVMPKAEDLEAYLSRIEERKDLVAALQTIRAARAELQGARGGYLPDVTLDGAYLTQQRPDSGRDWNVTLRVTLPIFQGGATMAEVREAKSNLKISELQLERLRRLANYEIRQSYVDYTSSAASLVLLRENVATAQLAFGVQQRDYRLGLVTNLEVLSSLNRYHQSRLALVRTESLLKINQLRLHVAAGYDIKSDQQVPENEPTTDQNSSQTKDNSK
ncbi:MAG: TolC family protein [Leptonema sp. (in: Bacteria)]|nr:TolC family protein [Leptonema sp. (in: bacteria)]